MILDGLPLEVMREVLLDLPTVDIIQTVKCTRRLYHFAKVDKALSRRLQNRVFDFRLHLGNDNPCVCCGEPMMWLYLNAKFRQANDAATQWNSSEFIFLFKYGCKCYYIADLMQEIEPDLLDHPSFLYDNHLLRGFENGTSFIIYRSPMSDAVIDCAKLFNVLMKFCVVRKLRLDLTNADRHEWNEMSAFFNANPPDLRIQPCVSIPSKINLDIILTCSIFLNGFAQISMHSTFGLEPGFWDDYHEVLRRTPNLSFFGLELPYTYEDLFEFFKDTKKLSLRSDTDITEQQICQIVQNFYEVKHDEERMLEIGFGRGFLVKDFLTLIPEEAYSLHLKRSGIVGPETEMMIWAEMTDKFGGRWALLQKAMSYDWGTNVNFLRICSMKYFTEHDQSDYDDEL